MGKKVVICFIIVYMLAMFYGCQCDREEPAEPSSITQVVVPEFDADSAYAFIERQVSFGPRVPGSKAWEECAMYLQEKLKQYGAEVTVQEARVRIWDGSLVPMKNIIGSWNIEARKRVLLCAHWDSRPYADWDPDPANHNKPVPGANDGASGVGVLLEIARHLVEHPPQIGIDIIFFDVEDWGEPKDDQSKAIKDDNWALGSQYWARNPHRKNYFAHYGILLDMVGAYDATFYHERYSYEFAPHILKKVWDAAHKLGYDKYFINERANPITDDHYYINTIAGLPTINIIHQDKQSATGFFKYWHTLEDTLDKISKETLKAVGQTVLYVIYHEK